MISIFTELCKVAILGHYLAEASESQSKFDSIFRRWADFVTNTLEASS